MKTLVNPLQVSRFLQKYDRAAVEKGLTIFVGLDFHEYVSIARATPTKDPTYPNFRPDRSPTKSGEGYCIKGHDENNKVAFFGAARLYDLSESNFAEPVESLKVFCAEPTLHAHPQNRCSCSAPSAKKILGKVAYHGDIWVREDLRGKGLPKVISGLQRGVSLCRWAPDGSEVKPWDAAKGRSVGSPNPTHCGSPPNNSAVARPDSLTNVMRQ